MAAEADKAGMEACGIEEYEFCATLDEATCSRCGALDGKRFPAKQGEPGVNMEPLHPNCGCYTVPVVEEFGGRAGTRLARDPESGENVKIPEDMTFEAWKAGFIAQHDQMNVDASRANVVDKKQFERYKAVLTSCPFMRSFEMFQQVKYSNDDTYSFIKLDYQRRLHLTKHSELRLPHAEEAEAATEKFSKYLFNPDNRHGWAKGVAFTSRLGYSSNNWEELRTLILESAIYYPAERVESTVYGVRYEQRIILYGLNGKPANVVVGWMYDGKRTWMTTAMIKEVK